ncbi:hypothetical protein RND71_015675 [Anisodus tanguticus]|uniref:Uncharacterized protein n=1 Tax=Anisodus tanguticus TaxID=243964 RepID=A0AAE1S6Z4_9SOLA|nr:hypothetical protein RND71_015675 [Anisodus tanguticus]
MRKEERTVIELQGQFGNKWARIATYLPGRTDNDVKNFWSSRQKRLARILRTSAPQSDKPHNNNNSSQTSAFQESSPVEDPLSAVPKAKISPIEASEDFHTDAAIEEMAGDNPPTEANPAHNSEVPVEIIPEDVLLFSKETKDSPVLATAYNDMALSLNDLLALHKKAKDSHDEVVAALQHLGSLRQEKKHIQTSFNEGFHLDNKIWELGNQQVVWELDQKVGSEWLAQLENEWTVWKNRLTRATPTLPASVAASVTQEVIPAAEQQPKDILAADIQTFSEIPSMVVAETLLDVEREFPEEVGADKINLVPMLDLVNPNSISFEPNLLQLDFTPNDQKKLGIKSSPIQTDFALALENQEFLMPNFTDVFGHEFNGSELDNVQVPLVPCADNVVKREI